MIRMTIVANILNVVIPNDMKNQAPKLLKAIWHDEFTDRTHFDLELSGPVLEFVSQARVIPYILIYQ